MTTLNDKNWWSRFYERIFGGGKRLDKGTSVEPFVSQSTGTGTTIDSEKALKLSAVWACIRIRSQTIASLPFHLKDKNRENAVEHQIYKLIHDFPNADMCSSEFWEAQIANLDLWGNAYSRINRIGGRVVSLDILDPQYMRVKRNNSGEIVYIYTKENADGGEYLESEILHFRGFTLDGLIGLSPISYQAHCMGIQIDANNAAAKAFKNNLKAGGFLKTGERVLTTDQRKLMREALSDFGKPENAGKWMILEAGMEPANMSGSWINPHDAQLLESRYFGIEEICRTFNVPPELIFSGSKTSSWASSAEQINQNFLTYSLTPTIRRIEQTVMRKLLEPRDRELFYPRFSVEGLLRADSAGRASFYTALLQNGVMTRNEVRALENLPPITGADQLTVQLNLTSIDKIGKDEDDI
ncbi:TPA: phage portal protein [Pasteurella multocida]|nr:phage portal protein [Pasteurella multocida]HDR1190952.1 phage portal protein [Pasteurella multocida]HDR1193181.1 phage portal protein [Pasteurella multocida]HDR1200507.1 phage portal protein [Pasteurella multocida]HDR1211810.1 phage portal protein [Pasteurella multocida]